MTRQQVQPLARVGADSPRQRATARAAATASSGAHALASLQRAAGASAAVQRLQGLQRMADSGAPAIQRMTVGGGRKASSVSGTTSGKHVCAVGDQPAAAKANFGSTTFVTSGALLTAAVDADAHDFASSTSRSDRHDMNATVNIYQYDKTGDPSTGGMAKGQDVACSASDAATNCEIGVVKTGANDLSITHFKKA